MAGSGIKKASCTTLRDTLLRSLMTLVPPLGLSAKRDGVRADYCNMVLCH